MAAPSHSSFALMALCALAAICTAPQRAQAVDANELSFPMLRNANTSRQWTLAVSLSYDGGQTSSPLNCSSPLYNACTDRYPVLMQDTPDQVQVRYTLANPRGSPNGTLNTWEGQAPTRYEFRICYTTNTSVDRSWRTKNKPYPRLSQNCPYKFGKQNFVGTAANVNTTANSGIAVLKFEDIDEVATATWFVMMWTYCGDSVCAFESTEGLPAANPPVPGNFFQTQVEMGITSGMRAAAIILSIIGPVFFIAFWFADHMRYKKTGKPITLVKNL